MAFEAKINDFEGPMDLLLHLLEKNKIDIYDIPVSLITDQYLEYLDGMEEQDPDVLSEFLVMASTLLDIKARMLLPKEVDEEGNEEDPREELVQKLLEYKTYKYMSIELKDRAVLASKHVYKGSSIPEEVAKYEAPMDLDDFMGDVTVLKLKLVFDDVMSRRSDRTNYRALEYGKISREEVKIEDRIDYIRSHVKKRKNVSFRKLLEERYEKMNIIVTFLAVLELMKTGDITAEMNDDDSDIILHTPGGTNGS